MLKLMRNSVNNIFVKILLGLLTLSFLFWGIGDMLKNSGNTYIAKVGNKEISKFEFLNSLRIETNRYQSLLGKKLDEETINKLQIKQQVLQKLIEQSLIENKIEDVGLTIGKNIILKKISSDPMFFDKEGKFSKEIFSSLLANNNISEKQYVGLLKTNLEIAIFLDSLSKFVPELNIAKDIVFNYNNEKRNADLIMLSKEAVNNMKKPSEEELKKFYEDNQREFIIPETRKITYLSFDIKTLSKGLTVSEKDLFEEYNQNISEYSEPEQRNIEQYNFANKEDAHKAYNEISENQMKIPEELKEKKILMEKITYSGLFDKIRIPVFNLNEGEITHPIETSLGWHIFMVTKIIKSKPLNFDKIRKEISESVFHKRASDLIYDISSKIDDEIASGNDIISIANKFSLKTFTTPPVTREGYVDGKDKKTNEIVKDKLFLEKAFELNEGEISDIIFFEETKKYVILSIDKILPQHKKSLEEEKDKAIKLWQDKDLEEALKETSTKISEEIKEEKDIDKIAKKYKATVKKGEVFERNQNNISVNLVNEIFNIEENEITSAYKGIDGNYYIAKVNKIVKADKNKESGKFEEFESDFYNKTTGDLMDQYSSFLHKIYPVKVKKTFNEERFDF